MHWSHTNSRCSAHCRSVVGRRLGSVDGLVPQVLGSAALDAGRVFKIVALVKDEPGQVGACIADVGQETAHERLTFQLPGGEFLQRLLLEPDQLATVARSSPCVVLLQVGFAEQPVTRTAGALLPHRFTLTARSWPTNQPRPRGGLLSVALSLSLRTVGVTHHLVLWSPDFPLRSPLIPKNRVVSQRPLGPLRPERSLYRLLLPESLTRLVRFLFGVRICVSQSIQTASNPSYPCFIELTGQIGADKVEL